MRTQAAVLYQAGTDWKVEEIELDPPRAGEVLVRVAAAGLCHSEEHHRVGDIPFAGPMIGGHEGAGYVEAVGPGVSLAQPGDYIWVPPNVRHREENPHIVPIHAAGLA